MRRIEARLLEEKISCVPVSCPDPGVSDIAIPVTQGAVGHAFYTRLDFP